MKNNNENINADFPKVQSNPCFTPGPWGVAQDRLVYAGDKYIADCEFGGMSPDDPNASEQHANARLIAAAPELFRTLAQLVKMAEDPDQNDINEMIVDVALYEAAAILAEVRGGTPNE